MFSQNKEETQLPISNLVPGFSFYESIGNSLGELLVDFFDAIAALIGKFRI